MEEWQCEKCAIVWDEETTNKYDNEYYCDECVDVLASEESREILETVRFEQDLQEYYKIKINYTKDYPSISINGGDFRQEVDYHDLLGVVLKIIKNYDEKEQTTDMVEQLNETYSRYK